VLGDSTANAWFESRSFQKQWRKQQPLNLAVAGDQTPHLLWRIERGILDGLAPRLLLLLIGADSLDAGFPPQDTVRGIRAVLEQVRARLPQTPVLILALLPAGQHKDDARRGLIEATNRQLSALAEPDKVLVVDVGGMFIEADGSLSTFAMADFARPTEMGHEALTTSISLVAQQLMQAAGR
jgi:lysophospholipase L1-like esterase